MFMAKGMMLNVVAALAIVRAAWANFMTRDVTS